MGFFYPEYSYSPRFSRKSIYSDSDHSRSEAHYRRLAEEHERRALAALALAEEEERRSAENQRQAAIRRLQQSIPYHARNHYTPEDLYSHPPSYQHAASSTYISYEQERREEHERQIEEWLQRRRLREQEEEEYRRRKELEKRRDEDIIRQLLRGFGFPASDGVTTPRSPRATTMPLSEPGRDRKGPRSSCSCGREHPEERDASRTPRREPSVARTNRAPSPQPTPAQPRLENSDFSSRLWVALNDGRSEEEKAGILSDLGLTPPTRPTATSVPVVVHAVPTATPKAASSKPEAVKSAPKPTTSTTTKSSSTPKSSTPAPTRVSPFAHIESIQVRFDAARSTFATNADSAQYESELNKLLATLDQVESSGSESVRGARKALVRAVESELEELEKRREANTPEVEHTEVAKEATFAAGEPVREATAEKIQDAAAAQPASEELPSEVVETEPVVTSAPAAVQKVEASSNAPEDVAAGATDSDDVLPVVEAESSTAAADAAQEEDRGRSATKAAPSIDAAAKQQKRPSSVVVEEVPDEGDMTSPKSDFEML